MFNKTGSDNGGGLILGGLIPEVPLYEQTVKSYPRHVIVRKVGKKCVKAELSNNEYIADVEDQYTRQVLDVKLKTEQTSRYWHTATVNCPGQSG